MVGRPPLPVGTFGKVTFLDQPGGRVQARAKFRDYDGRVRLVSRVGASKSAAEAALKKELRDRQTPAGGVGVRSDTRVGELAATWLAAPHDWSAGTQRTYQSVVQTQIEPALGDLRLREVNAGVINRALTAISVRSGHGAAKTSRSALSGMFRMAVADGAVPRNPVADSAARLKTTATKAPRALTVEQTQHLTSLVRESRRAVELDLPDLVDWMLATGCRIGEGLAARFDPGSDGRSLLDLDAGTWEINATVVRIRGQGLVVQGHTKTRAGLRTVALPHYAVALVRQRGITEGLLFPAPVAEGLRDPSNVSGDLRVLFDSFECEHCNQTGFQLNEDGSVKLGANNRPLRCDKGPWSWVTSHTFRKTVATRLDEAGLSPRQVADQLGHANPSMTQDVYFGRQVVSAAAAGVLQRPGS